MPDIDPLSQRFIDILDELKELYFRKQSDYGKPEDLFSNLRGATDWGVPQWVGAMIRANDKIRRLQTYAIQGNLLNESVEDAFNDLAVYTIIARVLREQELEEIRQKVSANYDEPLPSEYERRRLRGPLTSPERTP